MHPPHSPTPPESPAHAAPSQSPPSSPPRPMRQRAMAQLRPVSIPNIVSDLAGPQPVRRIAEFDRHYMPDGQPAAETSSRGISDAHRTELKQNAEGLSRSLSEVFAYLTHGTASLEEARKLLSIITNVSIMFLMCFIRSLILIIVLCASSWTLSRPISSILHCAPWPDTSDAQCCREIVRFSKDRLPKVPPTPHTPTHFSFTSDATRCPSALDGNQVLDFYWTDPIDAMTRSVAKLQYNGKLYTTFMPGTSIFHPGDRAFDLANSGMVFQAAYLVDTGSSPLLALFYADASFSGQSMTHHPIYSTY